MVGQKGSSSLPCSVHALLPNSRSTPVMSRRKTRLADAAIAANFVVDRCEGARVRAAGCTAQGRRPSNEDTHVLLSDWQGPTGPAALFAVCDGHGGAAVAKLTSQRLGDELARQDEAAWRTKDSRRAAVEGVFLALDQEFRASPNLRANTCGTTCVAAVLWQAPNVTQAVARTKLIDRTFSSPLSSCSGFCRRRLRGKSAPDLRDRSRSPRSRRETEPTSPRVGDTQRLIFANIGDSRGLLVRKEVGVVVSTFDHKPDVPEEAQRVRAAGGFVSSGANDTARVDGELACSRALGDFRWKANVDLQPVSQKVSPLPDVTELAVRVGDVVVLACDGVFDVLDNDAVAAIALGLCQEGGVADAAASIVKTSLEKGSWDNVTCVVAQICEAVPPRPARTQQ